MTKNFRVFNQTRQCTMKYSSALKGVQERSLIWVEEGTSVRQATLQESINLRNADEKLMEPLARAEHLGLVFRDPPNAMGTKEERRILMLQANDWPKQVSAVAQ